MCLRYVMFQIVTSKLQAFTSRNLIPIKVSPFKKYSLIYSGFSGQRTIYEEKQWNLKGLKEEVTRQSQKAFKKVSKAHDRIYNLESSCNSSSESIIILDQYKQELTELQNKLTMLRNVDTQLTSVRSQSDADFIQLLPEICRLGLSDKPPLRPERGAKRVKPQPTGPRLPYHIYKSIEDIEIRVGRTASDNDELSCNSKYRSGSNWWLHVANSPGSHVVIRSEEDNILTKYRQTVLDAALLAAVNSKAKEGGKVQVHLTRCRDVIKPKDVKPGMVNLIGTISTVTVDIRAESNRLERLKQIV